MLPVLLRPARLPWPKKWLEKSLIRSKTRLFRLIRTFYSWVGYPRRALENLAQHGVISCESECGLGGEFCGCVQNLGRYTVCTVPHKEWMPWGMEIAA